MKMKKSIFAIFIWVLCIAFQSINVVAQESEIKNIGMYDSHGQKIRADHEIDRLLEQQRLLTKNYEEAMRNVRMTKEEYTQLKERYEMDIARINDEINQQKNIAGDVMDTAKKWFWLATIAGAMIIGGQYLFSSADTLEQLAKKTELAEKAVLIEGEEEIARHIAADERERERLREKAFESMEKKYREKELEKQKEKTTTVDKSWIKRGLGLLAWIYGPQLGAAYFFEVWPLLTSPWFGITSGVPIIHPGIGLLGAAVLGAITGSEQFAESMSEKDIADMLKRQDPLFIR